jgi:hypothetical protein
LRLVVGKPDLQSTLRQGKYISHEDTRPDPQNQNTPAGQDNLRQKRDTDKHIHMQERETDRRGEREREREREREKDQRWGNRDTPSSISSEASPLSSGGGAARALEPALTAFSNNPCHFN